MTDKRRSSASNGSESRSGAGPTSLLDGLLKRAGRVAGGTLEVALDIATMSAMFGDNWLRDMLANGASPERLEAMAEAGRFLRDARETAGLSLHELSERLEIKDDEVLAGVESGEAILPLELMLRAASLLARHDPIPFLIKFLRSYNPQLEAALEQWGVMALPRNFERERRFVNLYRQHDFLRDLSDEAYQRFIEYMDASTHLVVDVMQREGEANRSARKRRAATPRKKTPSRRKSAPASSSAKAGSKVRSKARPKATAKTTASASRPVVRKVKPRNSAG